MPGASQLSLSQLRVSQLRAIDLKLAPAVATESTGPLAEDGLRMDEAAFRAFYEQTAHPLLGYLLRVTGDRELSEDVLQESYCRFLSHDLPAMDAAQSKSHLFRTASNLLRDRWRKRKEEPLREDASEIPSTAPHPERRMQVRQAFRQLKPRERQLLWLAYVEGSNHKEIADYTGLRAGSIRLLLFRARRKLAGLIRVGPLGPGSEVDL
jgi:RNA polymerase sigma-70 factor, ECF subfamily